MTQPIEFFAVSPPPPLDRFIETIWAVRGEGTRGRSAVLPNGAMQLIVNFGAAHRVLAFGDRAVDHRHDDVWIAGLQEAPLAIESPGGSDLLSIRFKPGGAHAFLGVPASVLANDVVVARDVLGAAAAELRERLAIAGDRTAQARVARDWLLARLRPREPELALAERAVAMLSHREPGESVAATCERLGVSNRHLIKVFRDTVGLAPKSYARIARFHAALRRLPRAASYAALAAEVGYADQAHFNHEFRRLAGVTPSEFVARRGLDDESVELG
jgi:AraC-like DNA-binding protein